MDTQVTQITSTTATIMEQPQCKTPLECKGTVGIVVDVIVGLKMVLLLMANL
jgi:hypothetical protein